MGQSLRLQGKSAIRNSLTALSSLPCLSLPRQSALCNLQSEMPPDRQRQGVPACAWAGCGLDACGCDEVTRWDCLQGQTGSLQDQAPPRGRNLLRLVEYALDLLGENRRLVLHNVPDDVHVDTEIVMDQYVAQTGDLLPLDLRMVALHVGR